MQSEISVETVGRMMPTFFTELRRDGRIDRALAFTRTAIRAEPDWWVPVLLLRLKSGALWYKPGFAEGEVVAGEVGCFAGVHARGGAAPPSLGRDCPNWCLVPSRDLARQWADRYHFRLPRMM